MLSTKERKHREKALYTMISLYCSGNHNTPPLCPECDSLYTYAIQRMDECPILDISTFCSSCQIHCYDEMNREGIRTIMRYSGKRMLLYHPFMTIKHLIQSFHIKKNNVS